MISQTSIFDISVLLGEESIDYPDDTPYSREQIVRLADGGSCDLSKLSLSAHSGTHIDAPAHFIEGGKNIDVISLDQFVLPALVVDVDRGDAILPETLSRISSEPGDAVLFRTKNSTSGRCCNGVFTEEYVYLTKEAAQVCVKKGISLVGIDYISIERYGDQSFEAHRCLLQSEVLVLEGINLKDVPVGRYTLICFPLKIKDAEASPVRAVLLK